MRAVALAAALAVLCSPAVALALARPPPANGHEVVTGARLWRSGGATVLVVDQPRPDRLLAALRAGNVTRISVLVAARAGSRTAQAIGPVRNRIAVDAVVTPAAPTGTTVTAGPFTVVVRATAPKFDVVVETSTDGR
jgi:hypothetical protein